MQKLARVSYKSNDKPMTRRDAKHLPSPPYLADPAVRTGISFFSALVLSILRLHPILRSQQASFEDIRVLCVRCPSSSGTFYCYYFFLARVVPVDHTGALCALGGLVHLATPRGAHCSLSSCRFNTSVYWILNTDLYLSDTLGGAWHIVILRIMT